MKKSEMFRQRWDNATDLDDYVNLIEDMLRYVKETEEGCA